MPALMNGGYIVLGAMWFMLVGMVVGYAMGIVCKQASSRNDETNGEDNSD